jgi:LacI family transcriptional regulator
LTEPKHRAPTITEVAKAAGVSRATVSRSFTRPDLLSPNTTHRIRAIAEKLGYVPNQVARALSTGRLGNIALIVPDIANPFFPPLIRAAQGSAEKAGIAVFLGDSDEIPEREDVLLTKFAPQVDGFVLASPRLSEQRVRAHASRRPLVLINRDIEGLPCVLMDIEQGISHAVAHLSDLGHRHLAYVSGPKASWANQQREKAVIQAAERHALELSSVAAAHPTYEGGLRSAEALADLAVTAVIAFDDLVAQGIMAGLAERGLHVPDDMSIIGFDDILAATTSPPLTSVAAHCSDAGRAAVERLAEIIQHGGSKGEHTIIPTRLVVRETTAPPNRHRSKKDKSETRKR